MTNRELIGQFTRAVETGDTRSARRLWTTHSDLLEGTNLTLDSYLEFAARRDDVAMMSLLVELGADIHAPQVPGPEGIIDRAASRGAVNVVRWLLDRGAQINFEVQGAVRCVPLTGAVIEGSAEVVRMLVEHGADVNAIWADQNALSFAIMYGHTEIADYLRSQGAREPWEIRGEEVPSAAATDESDPLFEHIAHCYGPLSPLALQEIVPCDPSVAIHVAELPDAKLLVTVGMSSLPMTVPPGEEAYRFAELTLALPRNWPLDAKALADPNCAWPIEWLRRLAHYPHKHDTWLGRSTVFTTKEPPPPLGPNTKLSCLLVLESADEATLLVLPNGDEIRFYDVFALYTEERDLQRKEGIPALLRRFEAQGIIPILDVDRPNVAVPQDKSTRPVS